MLAHRDIEVCCPLLAIGACDACETVQESSIRLVTTAVPRDSVREVSPAHFLSAPAIRNNLMVQEEGPDQDQRQDERQEEER